MNRSLRCLWQTLRLVCMACLLGLALAGPGAAHASAPLTLGARQFTDTHGHLALLRDPPAALSADEADRAKGWQPLPGALNLGYTHDAVWVRLTVQRPAEAAPDWLIQFSHALIDDVRLYRQDAHGHWQQIQHSGEDIGRSNWPVDARNVLLPLQLDDTAPVTLMLRLRTKNAMSTDISLGTRLAHTELALKENFFYGLGFGFCLLLVVFHTLFWQMTKEPLSGWYLLYVSNVMLIEFLTVGLGQQFLNLPVWLSDPLLGLSMCLGLSVGTRFAFMLLGIDQRWPRPTQRLRVLIGLISLSAAACMLTGRFGTGMMLMQPTALLAILLCLSCALWLLPRDGGQARIFLIVFGAYYAGVIISFLRNMGVVPPNIWTNHATALGTLLHMLLMSLRLNRRYDTLRREKEAAQARAVDAIGRLNDSLEQQVHDRTADLRQEIARREQLEDELRGALDTERQAKQQQQDFVAMVSHEFRTPLAIINTTAQQIARNLDAARDKTLARCANLRAAALRMTALVDEYLTADRMDAGQGLFKPRACDREELANLLDDLTSEWPAHRLQVRIQDLPATLSCDPGLVRVALRNLLANADRHTPDTHHMDLHVSQHPRLGLCFMVSNPGEAVPEDEVPRLFEKYFRGRLALQSPGAGLGLYLVHQIAELHRGQARLDSAGTDGAVRFSLTLPVAA